MSASKSWGNRDVISAWTKDEINNLELTFLHQMFDCRTAEGVDVTVTFATYMSRVKLDSDNYPVFLKLLQFENHWVVDALIGDNDPVIFFQAVQPNRFILESCFRMFTRWKPGGIYPTSLLVLFGLLTLCYENPLEGYRLYPLTIADINNLGKHLDESQSQNYPVNKTLLHILDRIAGLEDLGGLPAATKDVSNVAMQANNIRGKFLDSTKHLKEAIPAELLKKADFKAHEIPPSFSPKGPGGASVKTKTPSKAVKAPAPAKRKR
jgi:hypothetical protein